MTKIAVWNRSVANFACPVARPRQRRQSPSSRIPNTLTSQRCAGVIIVADEDIQFQPYQSFLSVEIRAVRKHLGDFSPDKLAGI